MRFAFIAVRLCLITIGFPSFRIASLRPNKYRYCYLYIDLLLINPYSIQIIFLLTIVLYSTILYSIQISDNKAPFSGKGLQTYTARQFRDRYEQVSEEMNQIFYKGFSDEEILTLEAGLGKVLENLTERENQIRNGGYHE